MSAYLYSPVLAATATAGNIAVQVTGVYGTGGTGVTIIGHSVTGVAGTGAVGSVTFVFNSDISVTGIEMVSTVGSVGGSDIDVTGLLGTSALNSVEVTTGTSAIVNATGVNATTYLNSTRSWGDIPGGVPVNWIEIQ